MSQSDIDVDFLEGLHKIINSIEKSADLADSVLIKDGVDHWCPDVQEWHTADHKPSEPPQVHINVADAEGDDPYKSENDVEKQSTVGNENIGGGTFGNKDENEGMVVLEDTEDDGEIEKIVPALAAVGGAIAGGIGQAVQGAAETGANAAAQMSDTDEQKEYDQNTNLPPEMGKREEGESVAEPFLRRRKISEIGDDIEKQGFGSVATPPSNTNETPEVPQPPQGVTGMTPLTTKSYDQPVDMLKIWASVDRELQKEDPSRIVDDLTILESFDLNIDLTTDELVEGTLVHKMLTNRSIRPTKEWWEASMNLAKSVEGVAEPGILSAFLYYESDHFAMGDFIDISKLNEVEHTSRGKPQDLEMMPNSSGGDGMAGLGLSAEELHRQSFAGPKDEDCD